MIALTSEARAQVEALTQHYLAAERPQAIRNLAHALAEASLMIVNAPEKGQSVPRPYPGLAIHNLKWIKRGRYWVAYDPVGLIIIGVFYDTNDIPARF